MAGTWQYTLWIAAVAMVAAVAVLLFPRGAHADLNCSDFSTQAEAQEVFVEVGGPSADPNGLDRDGDGVACDSLPCPCSTGPAEPPKNEDGKAPCPSPNQLVRLRNPRAAIWFAKKNAPGKKSRWQVRKVARGPRSEYATAAKKLCGGKVLRKSVYLRLHPRGIGCASCDLRGFYIKYRGGPWKLWATF